MAESILFDNPPIQGGRTEDQLRSLYAYLGNLSNQLNSAMMTITIEQTRAEEQQVKTKAAAAASDEPQTDSDFIKTKSLIIKTAELIRSEMDEIRVTLNGNIEALSEQFGEYQETITQEIIATAEGILQSFNIEERITDVEDEMSNFVRTQTSYIFAGILDQNTTPPTTGIAIGEGVTDENGALVDANKVVTITSSRISFYQNGSEVAYFSNNSFYISKGIVTDGLQMGNFMWKVFSNGSLALMKV